MRSNEAFPSRFLKCADLKGRAHTLIMGKIDSEHINGEDKLVLSFQNQEKALVLNKTNFCAIEEIYGDSDDWHGQPIVAAPDRTTYQGKRVDCVRLRAPVTAVAPKKAPAQNAPQSKANSGDEVSFGEPPDIPDEELERLARESAERSEDDGEL
jgi:hypothetical protein